MKDFKHFVLINAGENTRDNFTRGANGVPVEYLDSSSILLHVSYEGAIRFIRNNLPFDLSDTYVFVRKKADDSHFCGMLSEYLYYQDIPTNDPIHLSYRSSAGKISQTMQLALAKIPIPETMVFRHRSFQKNKVYITKHLSFPAVFKTDGSKGKQVYLVKTLKALEKNVSALRPNQLALVQPFIENTFDTRTIVAFGTILGTISRTRRKGFLNNIAQGGIPGTYELNKKAETIAHRAADACRIDVAGVDMIHTPKGPVVLEVNKSPEVGGFESVHGFSVFEKVAELLVARITKR